jgi:septum formation protein
VAGLARPRGRAHGYGYTVIVLASASPRRRELLASAGWPFCVQPAAIDETPLPRESPRSYVLRLARAKSRSIRPARPGKDTIVVGADTTVALGASILGKPASAAEAETMLRRLAGRRHEVFTGICLRQARSGREAAGVAVTHVWFRPLSPRQIAAYVATGEPGDKAGAYAIQGGAAAFVRRMEGSYANVVGLPLELLWQLWLELVAGAVR